jgi:hypothetical protein
MTCSGPPNGRFAYTTHALRRSTERSMPSRSMSPRAWARSSARGATLGDRAELQAIQSFEEWAAERKAQSMSWLRDE